MYNSQEIAKKIKSIVKQQKKTTGKMLEECGLSKNALSSMNSGYMPQLENIAKIADYLEVSVDTLLGREGVDKNISIPIIKDRDAVAKKLNELSDDKIDKVLGYIDGLSEN